MIDFQNTKFLKMKPVGGAEYGNMIAPMLVNGETVVSTFRAIRDGVVFTNKRIIAINIQGVTGRKKDFTSMPYSKIQVFSVETAGTFDLDSELTLWFSGVGKVVFEFTAGSNIVEICRIISAYTL